MKTLKIAATVLGLLAFVGCSASDPTPSVPSTPSSPSVSRENKNLFQCGGKRVSMEYINDGENIFLTEDNGKIHELNLSKSASGELYTDINGTSFHIKGRNAVFENTDGSSVNCTLIH